MKNFIYGLLTGSSFFITRWLFDVATTDIASKPYSWIAYLQIPLLIGIFYLTEEVNKNEKTNK
jgi:hypothetical protein